MKKRIALNLTILSLSAILLASFLTASCTKDDDTKVTGVRLNETELTLTEGDFETLVATVTPATATDRKVMWGSDDPDVAEVDDVGRVTAIKAGETNVTVTTDDGNKTASCKVIVEAIYVTGMTLNKETLTLVTGGSETLVVKVTPKNASDKNVKWSSNNPDVAEVDETGRVIAVKAGETNIMATTEDGERSASCSVTVVEGETIDVNGVSLPMVHVQGGTFWMGAQSDDPNGQNYDPDAWNSAPVHQVTLTQNYYIGQSEVTQWLWKAVMGNDNNPSSFNMDDNCPVEQVSWNDIVNDFLPKLNQMTGRTFALPTEAQWEFAARGGDNSKGYRYSGSNTPYDVAWYNINSNNKGTRPVGTKAPNELGIYDMSGNVWEWCSDWYEDYSAEPQIDPQGHEGGSRRVIRGGSWNYVVSDCTVSTRYKHYPDHRYNYFGFRLVLLP